jgi:hypothetical protein
LRSLDDYFFRNRQQTSSLTHPRSLSITICHDTQDGHQKDWQDLCHTGDTSSQLVWIAKPKLDIFTIDVKKATPSTTQQEFHGSNQPKRVWEMHQFGPTE